MKRTVLAIICLILGCNRTPAPRPAEFPGLKNLIEEAQFIVVAEIEKVPPDEEIDSHGNGIFEIRLIRVLKGEANAGKRAKALLHDMPYSMDPFNFAWLTQGFAPGRQYLLFLNRPGTHWLPPAGDFENADIEGDAILIGWPALGAILISTR